LSKKGVIEEWIIECGGRNSKSLEKAREVMMGKSNDENVA
jgi:hypothetical protein